MMTFQFSATTDNWPEGPRLKPDCLSISGVNYTCVSLEWYVKGGSKCKYWSRRIVVVPTPRFVTKFLADLSCFNNSLYATKMLKVIPSPIINNISKTLLLLTVTAFFFFILLARQTKI